ncbi:MAG TPA: hypothetical protein PLI44_03120 [Chiayiivirga sp.]|jgi:hypothetical protein|uniref:TniQ protein n=1 Tax=Denitratimonas tolerans TaxID=1338420 RepID=A0AAW9R3H7_9GAMM|nr:hypothetical protein [Chiayiivirga sp.]
MDESMDVLATLRPRLVGQDWSGYEGCSALGVVIRAARLNFLESGDIRRSLGLTIRRKLNLLRLLCASDRQTTLASVQGFDESFVTDWQLSTWWPFGSEPESDLMTARLRICPACAQYGYHTMLFQVPGVDVCPWHRVRLLEGCHRCGKPLLDGFDFGLEMLQCSCGHDHLQDTLRCITGDQSATSARHHALEMFRRTFKAQRCCSWLIGPGIWDEHALEALRMLTAHPAPLSSNAGGGCTLDRIRVMNTSDEHQSLILPDSGLEQSRPTVAKLPATWQPALRAILQRAAQMPSEGLLSDVELGALGVPSPPGGGRTDPDRTRYGLLRLRPSVVAQATYLHTGVIEGASLQVMGALADGICKKPLSIGDAHARRDFRRIVKQHPLGPTLISQALRRLLSRSYADGCRQVLGQVDPDLYRSRCTRPVRRFPWVALNFGDECASARIVWTRQHDQ